LLSFACEFALLTIGSLCRNGWLTFAETILDKVKLIDTLEKDEKNCLMKMIDIAIAKKAQNKIYP
jgi:hypothetical protein